MTYFVGRTFVVGEGFGPLPHFWSDPGIFRIQTLVGALYHYGYLPHSLVFFIGFLYKVNFTGVPKDAFISVPN